MLLDLSFRARPKGKTFLNLDRIPPEEAVVIEASFRLMGDINVPVLDLVTSFLLSRVDEESAGHLHVPYFSSSFALPQLTMTSPHPY